MDDQTAFNHIFTSQVIDRSWPFCNDPLETNDHLFMHCSFAQHVWTNTFTDLHPHNWTGSLFEWLESLSTNHTINFSELCLRILITFYQIWYARNHLIFRNMHKTPIQVCFATATMITQLNFDGSVKSHHQAAAGIVLRDGHGTPILASTTHLGYADVLIAEAMALRKGLRQALCKGYDTIHV